MGFWGQNRGRGIAILTPNKLVLTFECTYVCANFGENQSRNATVRVLADGQTYTQTQTQTDFIICPMLYAIAMGQIITIQWISVLIVDSRCFTELHFLNFTSRESKIRSGGEIHRICTF